MNNNILFELFGIEEMFSQIYMDGVTLSNFFPIDQLCI